MTVRELLDKAEGYFFCHADHNEYIHKEVLLHPADYVIVRFRPISPSRTAVEVREIDKNDI